MPSYDASAVAATFISEYYHTFCYKPKELPKLYSPEAEIRHAEGKDGMGKGAEVTNVLARLYPGENRGKIVISDLEILPSSSGSNSFRTKGVFSPTDMELPEVEFTQMFELNEWPEKTAKNEPCFYIASDIMSWGAAPSAAKAGPSPTLAAKKAEKSVPPPPTMATGDWAMETPPLFARKDKAEISPMDKPLGAAAAPALDLNKESSPAKASVFSKPAEEPKKVEEAPKAEEKPAAAPAKKAAWGAAAPAPKAEEPKKVEEAPKAEEKPVEKVEEKAPVQEEAPAAAEEEKEEATNDGVDLSKMSMLERIRYKQNIKEKPIPVKKEEEPKKEEKKSEKKAEEKKDGKPAADKKKEASGEKKGEKKSEKKAEGKKGEASVVYYDLILKGLPKGTAVEELYALLDQHVTVQKPIKLEARPDKADSNTIRTFAFVVLNTKQGKHKTVDEALPVLKRAKLQLNGVNVIVDRVREKYEK